MSRPLPPSPSLRFLQEEAKDLLKAQRRSDLGACRTLRLLRRFHALSDDAILAAYDAWADALEVDVDYEDAPLDPRGPENATASRSIIETRAMVHGDQTAMLAERTEAAAFLRRMSAHAGPAAGLLQEAAEMYEQIGKTNVFPWKVKHYMADEVKQGLQSHDLRRSFARDIRQAGAREAQAVALLESALEILDRVGGTQP